MNPPGNPAMWKSNYKILLKTRKAVLAVLGGLRLNFAGGLKPGIIQGNIVY